MDWLSTIVGFLVGLAGQLPGWFMLRNQQRKLDAETAKTSAETAGTWQDLYDGLVKSVKADNEQLRQERDLERERVRDLKACNDLLHEQKAAAIAANLHQTAEIARLREVRK